MNEENFIKEEAVDPPIPPIGFFPIEIPRILFDPDSSGTTFLGAFYSENAFRALYSSSAEGFSFFLIANLLTTSANRSVAPSGGFYSYFLPFLPFAFSFYFYFSRASY